MRCLHAFAALAAFCGAASAGTAETKALLSLLEDVQEEAEAKKILTPLFGELKALDSTVVEHVVLRQWWDISRELVAASHLQKVDFSFAVRKAVRTVKEEADELLRTLNPKYGQAHQVSPAFQWAQNDTCIFLTVKFTVRWNAPGALEVTDPAVVMTDNTFNFTGLGKHSNNKYKYTLALELFDNFLEGPSTWSTASVGKLSVTLRKRWPRKWPRLLGNKKLKIQNMHVWMEQQERIDSTLSGMQTVTNSPVTCAAVEKLYCLATDTCKKAENCSQCPGKTIAREEAHLCTGMPNEKASLSFSDDDMDQNQIGGTISLTKARNEFDIDKYVVYFGKSDRDKYEPEEGKYIKLGEAQPTGHNTEVTVAANTEIPAQATHLLVFSQNEYGEYSNPGSVIITDAFLPKAKPAGLAFEDEDGDKGKVSGTVSITRAADETHLDDYALHWGRSATRKTASSSLIANVGKGPDRKDGEPHAQTYYIGLHTNLPEGTQYLLAFSKNSHGELPQPVALKLVDNTKPCINNEDADCVKGVEVSGDEDPDKNEAKVTITVTPAEKHETVSHYVLYWGRNGCEEGSSGGNKNGHIKDIATDESLTHVLEENSYIPIGSSHVLVFSKNQYGESDHCEDAAFWDAGGDDPAVSQEKAEL